MFERAGLDRELRELGLDGLAEREYERSGARKGAHIPCGEASPWADRPCPRAEPSAELVEKRIDRLVSVIVEDIRKTTPHATEKGPTSLFGGSFDWHSCVHAHWALLSIARVTKRTTVDDWLKTRLVTKQLEAEMNHLRKQTSFERPYGRAWFLLMLAELEAHSWRPKDTAKWRQEVELDLCRWLEKSPYPEGSSTFDGAHSSWLFAMLLAWLAVPSSKVKPTLEKLLTSKVEPARGALAKWKHLDTDFLFLPAVQATLDRVALPSDKVPAYALDKPPALAAPPIDDARAHMPGAAVVRIWPFAIDARSATVAKTADAACSRYHTRVKELFTRPDQWADTFNVSHWVPQFIWMAEWLHRGRP
ncbi:MAG TPA: DUF2891 family protein [Labilithrix sp.]|nr:DUF2891 family protein [Labilithrix sp.]